LARLLAGRRATAERAILYRAGSSWREPGELHPLFWAWEALSDLVRNDPERARSVLQKMWKPDTTDQMLANIAAYPLEDLLKYHGEKFIDRVEEMTQSDPVFKKMLGAVWQNSIPDGVWNRVKAVAEPLNLYSHADHFRRLPFLYAAEPRASRPHGEEFRGCAGARFPEDGEARETFRMRIENTLFVQLLVVGRLEREGINAKLLSLMALITLAHAPVALMLFLEVKFLPYHSEKITWLEYSLSSRVFQQRPESC
jgi:hypothetical protein